MRERETQGMTALAIAAAAASPACVKLLLAPASRRKHPLDAVGPGSLHEAAADVACRRRCSQRLCISSQGVSAASCLPQSGVCLACKVDIAETLIAGPRLFHWVCVM